MIFILIGALWLGHCRGSTSADSSILFGVALAPEAGNSVTTSDIGSGMTVAYPRTYEEDGSPENPYEGLSLSCGENIRAFAAAVPHGSATDVEGLLTWALSNVSSWGSVNDYSLISRNSIDVSIPTEVASIELVMGSSQNSTGLRNGMMEYFANTTGASTTIDGLASAAPGETVSDTFRVVVQASRTDTGSVILAAMTPKSLFSASEGCMNAFVDGTNVGLAGQTLLPVNDNFASAAAAKADFIIALDNSGSMSNEIYGAAQAALDFFNRMQSLNLDFQIGVITTDTHRIRPGGFTTDVSTFQKDLLGGWTTGEGGWGTSKGSGPAYWMSASGDETSIDNASDTDGTMLKGSGAESGVYWSEQALLPGGTIESGSFLRPGAQKSVIIITDESDAYSKLDGSGSNDDAPQFSYSDNVFLDQGITVYGLVPLNDSTGLQGDCSGSNYASGTPNWSGLSATQSYEVNIRNLALATEGSVSSICADSSYAAFFNQIADSVAAKSNPYFLSATPISSSLKVTMNGVELERTGEPAAGQTGYLYNAGENKIVLTGTLPPTGTSLVVRYSYFN
ncbi:MAG: VWA domain-containing protein [Leptospiraceae bacterium]|nr:VWA domain-containing protein [Leptospiraceae bacterium]